MARSHSTPGNDQARNPASAGTALAVPSLLAGWELPQADSTSRPAVPNRRSAWFVSLVLHLVLLLVLSLITFSEVIQLPFVIESGLATTPEELMPVTMDAAAAVMDSNESSSQVSAEGAIGADSSGVAVQSSMVLKEQIASEFYGPGSQTPGEVISFETSQLSQPVLRAGKMTRADGVSGALDILTEEIAQSLQEGPTRVVWILDVSPSMTEYRQVIADRLEKIYAQLKAMKLPVETSLETGLMAFDDKPHALSTKTVKDPLKIRDLINRLPSTERGIENTYLAVMNARNRFGPAKERVPIRVMFIVVTDEEGSDVSRNLDHCIELMQKDLIRCFVIGKSTVLGRPVVETHRFDPSGQQYISVVEPGLETAYLEFMDPAAHSFFSYNQPTVLTGEAAFGLKRLCVETGGLFLMSSTDIDPAIDPEINEEFQPRYGDRLAVQRSLQFDPFRAGLVAVSEDCKTLGLGVPGSRFPIPNNLLVSGLTIPESRAMVAAFDAGLARNLKSLEELGPWRTRVRDRRSIANYDLAVSLLVAQRAYCQSYLGVLEQITSGKARPKQADHNMWQLIASSPIDEGGPVAEKLREKAHEMLSTVAESYPGTPWAVRARLELEGLYSKGWGISSYKVRVTPGFVPPRTPNPSPIRQNL